MRGRSSAGSVKSRRRKAAAPKRASGAETARPRSSSAVDQESEIATLAHDLHDALDRETAASEILNIISSAQAASVQPVLDTVVTNAARLCRALNATIYLRDDDSVIVRAQHGPPGLSPVGTRRPINRDWVTGAALLDARPIQVADLLNSEEYPAGRELARRLGHRTALAVPLLRDKTAIGVIVATRREVHPFSENQIALVQNFAAQAVIAIENARLLSELRQRTADLTESLEQQTASAEVLRVISSSPGELKPVFQALLENATRLCEARFGLLHLYENEALQLGAIHNAPPAFAEAIAQRGPSYRPGPLTPMWRALTTKQTVHISDYAEESAYKMRDPAAIRLVELAGARTVVAVPMLRELELIGIIQIYRQEVRPFTEKQIALVENFAAQAVIAIENARLLSELRESLDRQTATSEVLSVISSSRGDLAPIFHAILQNATRICEATFGSMLLREGDAFVRAAVHNAPAKFEEDIKNAPILRRGTAPSVDRVIDTRQVIQTLDAAREQPDAPIAKYAGARTLVDVPLLKGDEAIGVLGIYRQEVRPFTDRQIELVKNFAAQAVIAIENARLLNELRQRTTDLSESLEQQTASAEVLKIISSSPGELQPVFTAMLENATRICDAKFANLHLYENGAFRRVTSYGTPSAWREEISRVPIIRPNGINPLFRIVTTKAVLDIPDIAAEPAYIERDPVVVGLVEKAGARTIVGVPMLKETELIGAITVFHQEVRPFTDKQIELLQNFAAQAVIAIENARLLNELRQRTEEVVKLNQQLEQRVADQVGEIERMSRLRRFLPPQVADLIVASGMEKQLESHRREITALFCDLRGFTGFSESSDPEDVMALLAEYHAAIGAIINKYSGTLERYAGDGVMVIFNDPVPVENPALQAVLMALDMRTAIEALMQKWRLLGHDIGFGIGIAHGFATLGTIGFEGRRDYAAIGTVSNVASRLCDEAKPGQILIAPRVLLAVDKAVTVEQVGEFALKGIRRPMLAYNVIASLAAQ